MSLSDRIEAGAGSDKAVALALGFTCKLEVAAGLHEPLEWLVWSSPDGVEIDDLPAFLTDLNAPAAECERRGLEFAVGIDGGEGWANVMPAGGHYFAEQEKDGRASTPARALCAALIRAVEGEK